MEINAGMHSARQTTTNYTLSLFSIQEDKKRSHAVPDVVHKIWFDESIRASNIFVTWKFIYAWLK